MDSTVRIQRSSVCLSSLEFSSLLRSKSITSPPVPFVSFDRHLLTLVKGKGKGNLFYVKNTGSGCPSLPSQGLMIEVFDIHVKRKKKKKKKKRFKNYILKNLILLYY